MAKNIWAGEFYRRIKSGDSRNRRTGEVITSHPRIIKRRGRNAIIIPQGIRVIGVEERGHHFSGRDKPPQLKTNQRIINTTRTRSRQEQKAIHAKLRGR